MRWVWLFLFLLLLPQGLAITMNCPESAEQYANFVNSVSHTGATQVRLFHHGNWDVKSGSSASWTISEAIVEQKTYWGDAYVGGAWISTGNNLCVVQITAPDNPGTVSISVTPSSIENGESVNIEVSFTDLDGTAEIVVYRGSTMIYVGGTAACSGTTCYFSTPHSPTSSTTYTALAYDSDQNEYSDSDSVYVTGITYPSVGLTVSPTSLTTGQSATFAVSATDDGGDLKRIRVYYGDGTSATYTCPSGDSCSRSWTHSYTTSGTKQAYGWAEDDPGHTGESQQVAVYVSAPADADGDGIPDSSDVCDNTPLEWRPIVTATSDPYRGCACDEIINFQPDPTRDTNPCTDDTCSINGQGYFVAVHTPITGGQPEGYVDGCSGTSWIDYTCTAGSVTSTTIPNDPRCVTCTPHHHQGCWNGDAWWYDSCNNRQDLFDDCGTGEICVVNGATASCVVQTICTPTNGGIEVCDGLDNDCDGTIDGPGLCGYGMICTAGTCNCNSLTCPGPCCNNVCCAAGQTCVSNLCTTSCTPNCVGRSCGDNGCGGSCGSCGGSTPVCLVQGSASSCVACTPGTSQSCYEGPPGTVGVGVCVAGTKTCSASGSWGACVGQSLPGTEVCNGVNDDCDSQTDEGTCSSGSCMNNGTSWLCGVCSSPDQCHEQPDNLCTTDNCVSGACTHVNLQNGASCTGGHCEAPAGGVSVCKADCAAPYWCALQQPGFTMLFDQYYCLDYFQCWGCDSGYTNCGNACFDLTKENSHCGSCTNACGAGFTCTASQCVMNSVAITGTLSPELVVADYPFTIQYVLTPEAGNIILSNDGWPHYTFTADYPRTLSIVPGHGDVGERRVTVKAYENSLTGKFLGSVTTRVLVTCNPAEPGYGPCCVEGTAGWNHEGELCDYNGIHQVIP